MKKYLSVCIAILLISAFFLINSNRNKSPKIVANHSLDHLNPADQYFLGRNYPNIGDGEIAYKKAVEMAQKDLKKHRNQNTPWTIEGPHNIGGRISSIAIDPNNSNIIYIGTPNAGIFKSTDGGSTWIQKFNTETTLAIGMITIDPSNSNTIYVGTGDRALSSFTYLGNGVYKSTDAGNTWTNIGLTQSGVITKLLVNPNNPSIIYAGTMGNIYNANNNRGLYKTLNGGNTWTQILFLGTDAGIGDLQMDNNHPDTLFATGRNRFRSNFSSYVIGPAARIFRSYNGGNTWDTLSAGLPTGDQCKITLALSQSNPQLIYAAYCDTAREYGGIYKSINGGNTWTFLSQDPNMDMGGFGWYFGEIFLDPNNDSKIYWLGVDLFRSSNGGATWSKNAPNWYTYDVHADKHDLQFVNSNTYFLATDGGLYKTSVGGGTNAANWSYKSSIPITQFYRVGYNPWDSMKYFGGAQDNGTESGSLATGLNNWNRYFGGDGFRPAFDITDPLIYYTETQNGNINATDNGGINYTNITQSLTSTDRTNWNTPYVLSKHAIQTMYVGTYKIYKNTTSLYDNWIDISPDLTDGTNDIHHNISALDQSSLNASILYAGTSDARIWVTQNEGATWTQVNNGMPNRYISSVKASPNNLSSAFVSYWGYRDDDTTAYIYFTSNYGSTWTNIAGPGLPNFAINDIWIKPDGKDSSIIVANDGGVYSTINRGQKWIRVGNNMPIIPVYAIDYNPATKKIIAGTFAMGIQTMIIDSALESTPPVINSGIKDYESLNCSIYPNPVVNVLHIVPDFDGSYTVLLTNGLGQNVVNFATQKGQSELNLENLPLGLYYLTVQQGHKKMQTKIMK